MRPASGLLGEVQQARARAAEAERLVEQARRWAGLLLSDDAGFAYQCLDLERDLIEAIPDRWTPFDPTLAAAIEARPSLDDLLRGESS